MTEPRDRDQPRRSLLDEWQGSRVAEFSTTQARATLLQHPVRYREVVSLGLIVLLCDLTLYHSKGYMGPAMTLFVMPGLLWMGLFRPKLSSYAYVIGPLLLLLVCRLAWCGSDLGVAVGFVLLGCWSMSLSGLPPFFTRIIVYTAHLVAAGHRGLHYYWRSGKRWTWFLERVRWFEVFFPLAVLMTFAVFFVMANPDLVKSFGQNMTRMAEWITNWSVNFSWTEVLFCWATGWIAVGMLRPDAEHLRTIESAGQAPSITEKSPLYPAFRNTLVLVIGLFAIYLAFEFRTLWFRKFPVGFHYSGYAHEGAAWLTVALGTSTVLLSLIFSGSISGDPRRTWLRGLAWIWSIENLLLAAAVFNRLSIYVGFNGMTRMRVIGLLGVASVVGGFLLVLRKIACHYDFAWLIRRQLWTVGFATYLYAVLPVDAFVNSYNVQQILVGNLAPSVQICVHPTSDEGRLLWAPLVNCADEVIRKGVRALLDQRREVLGSPLSSERLDWTSTQLSTRLLEAQLRENVPRWNVDREEMTRDAAIQRFVDYTYRWY